MRALSMKARWLKHEWFWKVRWIFLLAFGVGLMSIPTFVVLRLFSTLDSDGKAGIVIGVSCGLAGGYGLFIVVDLVYYAFRRIKLGRKVEGQRVCQKEIKYAPNVED